MQFAKNVDEIGLRSRLQNAEQAQQEIRMFFGENLEAPVVGGVRGEASRLQQRRIVVCITLAGGVQFDVWRSALWQTSKKNALTQPALAARRRGASTAVRIARLRRIPWNSPAIAVTRVAGPTP